MVVGGFALLELLVTPDGKRVFLFVVTNTSNAMLRMTTTAVTVQKAAVGRPKSPPLAVKKPYTKIYFAKLPPDTKIFFVDLCPNTKIFCSEIRSDTEIFGLFAHCG